MRTTLTLDDDVAAKLRSETKKTGRPFKETVNHFLRLGLNARLEIKAVKPFKVRARPLGLRPGLNYDNIGELIDQLEDPLHR